MTSGEETQLLVPPPAAAKDEEDSSEALNKLKFHTKKMNWNLKILKDQLTGLEDSGNSLSRQMASMYRTFQEMKEAGEISDVEIEIDEEELSSPNSRISDTTGIGSYDRSFSADDAMDTEDELEDFSDLDTDSTASSGQRKKHGYNQMSRDPSDTCNEKRKRLTHRIKRQSSDVKSDSDSECDNDQCSCCMSRSSFGSVTPSKRYYFEDRSRADDTSSSSCSDYEEPIKRNTMPLHERHSPFYNPGDGNSSSEEEDICKDNMDNLLTPHGVTKEFSDRDSETSLQKRLSPLGCESPKHYDSHGNVVSVPSENESDDKSLEDKVKELTVELEHCKEEISKRTQMRKLSKDSISLEQDIIVGLVENGNKSDNEADLSLKSDSSLNSVNISDKRKLFEKEIQKEAEQRTKRPLKRKDSIGNAMMDKLKAQFESSDAKTSGTALRENLGAKGRRDSIKDKIKIIENKVQEESDDSSTLKSTSESRALQKKLEASKKVSNALKQVFEKDLNQNHVSPKSTLKQTKTKEKKCADQGKLLSVPSVDKHSKKTNKKNNESKGDIATKPSGGKSSLPRPMASKDTIQPGDETPDVDYEKRDKVAAKKKFKELQNMWQPKLVVNASGKQTKPELQKRIQRLQKAALNTGHSSIPKGSKRAVSRAVIHMNKKEKNDPKTMEFNSESGEVIIGQTTETDKDGYKTVKLRGNGLVVTLKINPNGKNTKSADVKVCPSCHKHNEKGSKKAASDEMRLVVPQTKQRIELGDEVHIVVPQNITNHGTTKTQVAQPQRKISPYTPQQERVVPHIPQQTRVIPIQRLAQVPVSPTSTRNQNIFPQAANMHRRVSVPARMNDTKVPVRKMSTSSITTYVNGSDAPVQPGQRYITVTPSESYSNQSSAPRIVVKNHQMDTQTGQQRITVIPIQTAGQTPRFQLKSVSGGGGTVRMQQAKSTTKYRIINTRQDST
ncbi:uncharacterized protein [Antedon mediterranea]|uniref:uncharacterized protein n=1 Tax=Antedon mediterranea TaxID=105859 RepID=UPI003AF726EA